MDSPSSDVIILCGGLGTRLRSVVSDVPKPMAPVAGKPFLDLLLEYVIAFGFKRFILCTGYQSHVIHHHYQKTFSHVEIVISQESSPLGTAGAVKQARRHIRAEHPFIVMNGDSFCPLDFRDLLRFHQEHEASLSITLSPRQSEQDYGLVYLDASRRVVSFREKGKLPAADPNVASPVSTGWLNAGVYVWESVILEQIPENKMYSIENDLFPSLLDQKFYGYLCGRDFIDIGTPERYQAAQTQILQAL